MKLFPHIFLRDERNSFMLWVRQRPWVVCGLSFTSKTVREDLQLFHACYRTMRELSLDMIQLSPALAYSFPSLTLFNIVPTPLGAQKLTRDIESSGGVALFKVRLERFLERMPSELVISITLESYRDCVAADKNPFITMHIYPLVHQLYVLGGLFVNPCYMRLFQCMDQLNTLRFYGVDSLHNINSFTRYTLVSLTFSSGLSEYTSFVACANLEILSIEVRTNECQTALFKRLSDWIQDLPRLNRIILTSSGQEISC